jgi:hypothetical protein
VTPGTLLQILIALGVILSLWNKQRQAAARARGEGRPAGRPDPLEEERTRRVQEEIRRKIADRNAWEEARRAEPPQPGEAAPVEAEPEPEPAAEAPRPVPAPQVPPERWDPPPAAAPPRDWLGDLRETQGARRAIILREILGPPVGLR